MANKVINEYLAEHLFGFEHGGYYENGDKQFYIPVETDEKCDSYYDCQTAPDYCSNAIPVLEKLSEQCTQVFLHFKGTEENGTANKYDECRIYSYKCEMPQNGRGITDFGDTIHEAICRCAVEYLKSWEGSDLVEKELE